jgi:5-methylcytosine-specific restriction endonuclease McrA
VPGSFCVVCRRRIPRGSRCKRHAVKSPSNRAWHQPGASKLRKSMLSPSNGCVICGNHEDLQLHHIEPARDGGGTEPKNLAVLCARHHRDVESGQLSLPA